MTVIVDIYNRYTGEKFEVDPVASRRNRMISRVRDWSTCADVKDTYNVMVTLTLRTVDDYKFNMIRPLIRKLREHYKKNLVAYAWVTEMQKRQVPHYHLILCFKKPVMRLKLDELGWWPYGMTSWEKARTHWYIVTYLGKEYQKENLPVGARMFTVWVDPHFVQARLLLIWLISPHKRWVSDIVFKLLAAGADDISIRRLRRGGGVEINGDVYYSPWVQCITEVEWEVVKQTSAPTS